MRAQRSKRTAVPTVEVRSVDEDYDSDDEPPPSLAVRETNEGRLLRNAGVTLLVFGGLCKVVTPTLCAGSPRVGEGPRAGGELRAEQACSLSS